MHWRWLILSLCLVGGLVVAAADRVHTQMAMDPVTPRVISGDDFGFRVTGLRGNTPVGRFVVRVNGVWVDVEEAGNAGPLPLSRD